MNFRIATLAALASLLFHGAAHALAITAVPVSTVTNAPFALGDFGTAGTNGLVSSATVWLSNGSVTFGYTSSAPAGVYDGNVSGVAASPTTGRNYLVAEPGSAVTFNFTTPQTQFQLLWGTVDDYNALTFTRTDGTSLTLTGADIRAVDGTAESAYVTIASVGLFNKVMASSTSPAFEFLPNVSVSEPGTVVLVAACLGGLVWMRRRRV